MTSSLSGFPPSQIRRLVIKIGSALLVDPKGEVRQSWLRTLVADIAARKAAGQQIIIVSSGAIALGARRLKLPKGGRGSLEDAQAAAATGQIALSQCWASLLHERGITAAQMLVTLDDLENRRRYLNASATLERLMALDVVPVVNENDSVATAEIRFGDNDRLAARIGQAARADAVVLLSDVDGLYTANPHVDADAMLIETIERIDARIAGMADGGSASGMGSGGMTSKIEAARIATGAGAHLAIISGKVDSPLSHWTDGGKGSIFLAAQARGARKGWLAGRLTVRGRIVVDAGAEAALGRGNSLLPAGVARVDGIFARGDVVDILAEDGRVIARGLIEYDSEEASRIAGKRSEDIAALLGHLPRSVLVHRDHMAMV
ncbi:MULTISPECIES: glutamate 5-kinase [Sphingobium]|jgi:glutamate 5-kinase|uniref:Glutamate 5-kinase n=2 Tax=Sphingobium fuliginis (strain ATCC 27551) TaxID=336203 RepID=A0A292ZI84_SPHSA|nr:MULTISPECIES: glutamate 5-kinase [Sphingobium]QDC35932.1 glutamate 5-kinase [Sphingobium fuliginis ATCC 27551]QOT71697.1 glutamate 5-kinase [Sphingobium fuliginis]UXC90999.1 glutamate 5-kinase [Sphingobium sp. RSMS]GAY22604.1 glutamate 5-kinase [Sphingobium fuliginis]